MSRYYEKLPENFDQMSDQEIETWAERLWLKNSQPWGLMQW